MNNPAKQLSQSHDVTAKVAQVLQTPHEARVGALRRAGAGRRRAAGRRVDGEAAARHGRPGRAARNTRSTSRSARSCFWDTLRQRGNNFIEHERQGLPPVLHFEHETVMDGRTLERPVNYALLRIVPPAGVHGRCQAPSLRDHRPARRPRPRHRRLQGRLAGRRRAARRPSGLLRHLLPESRAGPDAAGRVQRRTRVRAPRARAASRCARSPRSSATARAAGRR